MSKNSKWTTTKQNPDDPLYAVFFTARNKDNKGHIEGFRERKSAFLFHLPSPETALSNKTVAKRFEQFTNDGLPGELSRMYVSLNARDVVKIKRELMHLLIDDALPGRTPESNMDTVMVSIAMRKGMNKEKRWLFDYDIPVNREDPKEFARDIMERTKENGAVKAEVFPTPHGAAVITDHGFDVRLLGDKWKDYMDKGDITLKRDDLLCIAWQTNDIYKKENDIAVKLRQMEDMYLHMASLAQSGIAHSRPETAKKLVAMYQETNRMFSDAFTGLCEDLIAWNDL